MLRRQDNHAEAALWATLRRKRLRVKFRRQEPIGRYIVDFVCFERQLVVEVDGSQHDEAAVQQKDDDRTAWLESQGFKVLRFWSNDVLRDTDAICEAILNALSLESPSPYPSPIKGEGRSIGGLAPT